MFSVLSAARRAMLVLCAVVAVGALGAGCSTVGPDDGSNATGSLDGTVRSDRGDCVPSMEVRLWCAGTTQSSELEYVATTDPSGTFGLDGVDLGDPDALAKTYEVYVNRTRDSETPLNDWYGTYSGAVSVERDPSGTVEFVLRWIDHTPEQPTEIVMP